MRAFGIFGNTSSASERLGGALPVQNLNEQGSPYSSCFCIASTNCLSVTDCNFSETAFELSPERCFAAAPRCRISSSAGTSFISTETVSSDFKSNVPSSRPLHEVLHGPRGSTYTAMQPCGHVIVQLGCPGAVHVDICISFRALA